MNEADDLRARPNEQLQADLEHAHDIGKPFDIGLGSIRGGQVQRKDDELLGVFSRFHGTSPVFGNVKKLL